MPKGGKQRERERAREAEEKEKQAMLNFDSPQERDAAEKHASKIQAIIRGRAARNPTAVALRNAWDEVDTGALGVLDRQGLHRVFDKMFDRPKMTTEEFLQATKAIATVGPKKDSFIFNDVRLWVIARKDSNVQSVVMQVELGMKLLRLAQKARKHRVAAREGYAMGMEHGMEEDQLMVMENIFFDTEVNENGYGMLGSEQVLALMMKMKIKRTPLEWQLRRVFQDIAFKTKSADTDDGKADDGEADETPENITYETFVQQVCLEVNDKEKGIKKPNNLAELFHVLDYDNISEAAEGDGELSSSELKLFLEMGDLHGKEVSDSDAKLMLSMADIMASDGVTSNDDGKLMADEFVHLMVMYNERDPVYKQSWAARGLSEADFNHGSALWRKFRSVLFVLLYLNSLFDKCSHYSEEYLEQWTAAVDARCCFFNPDAPKRQAWDLAMLPLFMIIIIMVPLRIGFDYDEPPGTVWWWIDAGTDIYFLIDIVINFRTAFHDEHGQLVTNLKEIRKSYLKSWFLIDFLSCLPIPYVLLMIQAFQDSDENGGGSQFKLAKILRLVRLAKNLARLGRLSKLKELVAQWEDYLEPIMTGLQLMKLLLILLLLGHMMACVWYYVGVSNEEREDNFLVYGWVYEERWGNKVSRWTRYIASYAYSLTDFTYEVSNTNTEKITAVVLHLIYETFFGYLVGTFATIVMAGKVADQVKGEKLQAVRDVTKHAKLPPKVRKQFRAYYDVMFKYKSVFDEEIIIDELPESIRRVLVDHKVKLFKGDYRFFAHDFTSDIILKTALKMRRMHVQQGTPIVCEGDEARDVYFLIQGQAVVEKASAVDGQMVQVGMIANGMMFGEVELVAVVEGRDMRRIRQRTVKARSTLDVGFIKYVEMWDEVNGTGLMQQFHMLKHRVVSYSKRRQDAERKKMLLDKGMDIEAADAVDEGEASDEDNHVVTTDERMTRLEGELGGFKRDVLQKFDQMFVHLGIPVLETADK